MAEPSKIALISSHPWAGVSSPLINTLHFLGAREKACDVYYEYHTNYDLSKINEPPICSPLQRNIRNRYPLQRNPVWRLAMLVPGMITFNSAPSNSVSFSFGRRNINFPSAMIPDGAVRAYLLWKRRGIPYLVHSLELSEQDGSSALERKAFANARAILTTDPMRGEIVARKYNLPDDKIITLPNSSIGHFNDSKSPYFRQKLGIADQDLIVLCTGSLGKDHCVDLIIEGVLQWPDGFVLVLHGWDLSQELRERVHAINALRPGKIFISEEMLPFQEKQIVFSSTDIGIVAFSETSFNHRYAAGSAGKLYDFSQAGVPVLANDIPGMRDIVEGHNIGKIIPSFLEAGAALPAMKASREGYRSACEQFFSSHEFSRCFEAILNRLGLL